MITIFKISLFGCLWMTQLLSFCIIFSIFILTALTDITLIHWLKTNYLLFQVNKSVWLHKSIVFIFFSFSSKIWFLLEVFEYYLFLFIFYPLWRKLSGSLFYVGLTQVFEIKALICICASRQGVVPAEGMKE